MEKKTLKVDPEFYTVLVQQQLNDFTIMELRDAIIQASPDDSDLSTKQQQKRAYRLIHRLIKYSLFQANKKSGSCIRYERTGKFSQVQLQPKDEPVDPKKSSATKVEEVNTKTRDELLKLLDEYQVDLIASLAESEEYKRLQKEMPELESELKSPYLDARQENSKILGKIKAVSKTLVGLGCHIQ